MFEKYRIIKVKFVLILSISLVLMLASIGVQGIRSQTIITWTNKNPAALPPGRSDPAKLMIQNPIE